MATSIRPRGLSRRDHVLNLLPPLTVVNKEDATLHDRLFSDDPPAKNHPKSFPSKVLRHLGEWTFYSVPTKGELALLDKNMYDLETETENPNKTEAEEKKTEHEKHTPGAQSQCAGDDKKRLETRKGMTLKKKQNQQTKDEGKNFKAEANEVVEQQNAGFSPETTQGECSEANSIEKTKQVGGKNCNNVEATKIKAKRLSYVTYAPKKLTKNAQVKSVKSHVPPALAKVEITLKKSRGKVLGGAESGDEITTEPLTVEGSVEGHNMSVPGSHRKPGHTKERTHDIERAGTHKEAVKINTIELKDSEEERRNSFITCDSDTADVNANDGKTVLPEKAQLRNPKRSVIKIPLQEIDSSEEADNNNRVITPKTQAELAIKPENVDSESADSPAKEQCENAVKSTASPENLCGNLDNDVLCDKRVTFDPNSEKERENEKKRAESQTGSKNERKRGGKNRVKSG